MAWGSGRQNWGEMCGRVRDRWIELDRQDIAEIDGSRDRLIERLKLRYNMTHEQAEKQVYEWESKLPRFSA